MTEDSKNSSSKGKNKRELLNVLKMYSPAVIALNDVFFGKNKTKDKTVTTELNKKYI